LSKDHDSPVRHSAWLYFAAGVAAVYAWNSPLGATPRQLAGQGIALAEYDLASMYFDGDVIAKDQARAAHWYRLAARRGNVDAALKLSRMYANGEGVPVSAPLAQQWSQVAVTRESTARLNPTTANAPINPSDPTAGGLVNGTAEPARNDIPPMDLGPAFAVAEDAENREQEFRRNQQDEERVRLQNQEFADQARERDRLRIEAEDRQREENSRMIEEQNNAANSAATAYGSGGQNTSNE